MRWQTHRHRGPGARTELVAQHIGGLGGPVGQRHRREFDAFADGVVVVGDPWGGIVHLAQQECGQCRHQLTQRGPLAAVKIGDGGGGGVSSSAGPVSEAAGVVSRPDPGPW
ncbi:Uncharacterised protein [Mycobacteroides abscessus subsp. massiliense]|nr:Uncharacterised protein [Mycobacteroides abscessus subsp. massiliense]